MYSNLKVAIVHDWLNQIGGAENVLEEMVNLFPKAHIFTSIFASDKMPESYSQWPIHTSFMQHLPGIANRHQPYMPIYPLAFQQFNLAEYDLILSNKSGFCHGVGTSESWYKNSRNKSPIHICYCLTPTRFLWSFEQYQARENIGTTANLLLKPLLPALRKWDRNAADNVHFFIAISSEIQRRIKQTYNRESVIIYPPVDTAYFTPSYFNSDEDNSVSDKSSKSVDKLPDIPPVSNSHSSTDTVNTAVGATADTAVSQPHIGPVESKLASLIDENQYFLIVSRLIPYKRIDLAVQAFAKLPNETLVIVGDGRDRPSLEAMATKNVQFMGRRKRAQIRELLRHCKAFIFPGLEDFGIAPVEAMSTGRPVIAFAGGGALDTVVPGISGELFQQQTPNSLFEVLRNFDAKDYSPEKCRNQAEKFSTQNFHRKLYQYIESVID